MVLCATAGPAAICRAARTTGALQDTVDLAPRAAVRYTLTVTVPPGQSGPTGQYRHGRAPPGWIDVNLANNTATVTSAAAPSADLYVSKTSTPKPYVAGQTLTYTMVVTNRGPSNVTGARVQDILPTALAGFGWTCTPSSGATCPTPASGTGNINVLVNLPVGASATFELSGVLGTTCRGADPEHRDGDATGRRGRPRAGQQQRHRQQSRPSRQPIS